jgi:hypothetical protein
MEITSASYTERRSIHTVIDGVEYDIPDEIYDQELRDPETDELTGEVVRIAGNDMRRLILEWENAGNVIGPYVPKPAPLNSIISDRQFFQQLAIMGLITEQEALAYVQTGTLPSAFLGFIDQLPADQRFDARMKLTGANSFHRDNPLVNAFAGMYGMASADVDNLWRAASTL